jgi:hypothetical protein
VKIYFDITGKKWEYLFHAGEVQPSDTAILILTVGLVERARRKGKQSGKPYSYAVRNNWHMFFDILRLVAGLCKHYSFD